MSSKVPYQNVGYGLTNALPTIFQPPIIAKRAPTSADQADLGAIWIYPAQNTSWNLTSIVAGKATWTTSGGSGGNGVFASVEATTGNITADVGNIVATAGSISAATTITAGGSIISTAGNIGTLSGNISASGNVIAGTGMLVTTGGITVSSGNVMVSGSVSAGSVLSARSLAATGDSGGFATITTFTNVTDTAQSTGTLSIKSDSANNGNNTGFLKVYVGLTTAYVPYFTTIAP